MRTLFVGVLAAHLVGCAAQIDSRPLVLWVPAQEARSTESTSPPTRSSAPSGKKTKAVAQRAKRTVAGTTTAPSPPTQPNDNADPITEKKSKAVAQQAKRTVAGTTTAPLPPTQPNANADPITEKKSKAVAQQARRTVDGTTTAPLPPTQPNANADPITEKAKARIAAMMENPASAEFSRLERAVKMLLTNSYDTICGYVKGKTASGEDTGEMPFLYIIDDGPGRAYLVDGKSSAGEVYRAICR